MPLNIKNHIMRRVEGVPCNQCGGTYVLTTFEKSYSTHCRVVLARVADGACSRCESTRVPAIKQNMLPAVIPYEQELATKVSSDRALVAWIEREKVLAGTVTDIMELGQDFTLDVDTVWYSKVDTHELRSHKVNEIGNYQYYPPETDRPSEYQLALKYEDKRAWWDK